MESTTVIKRPLITEKATFTSAEFNRYAFEVDHRATKDQIRRAIADLYGVRVMGVATQIRKGRLRRTKFGWVKGTKKKRAIVKVHPDDRIELF